MWKWLKNAAKHPQTTAAGVGSLLASALVCYGMATGKAPIDAQTIGIAGGLFSTGIGGIAAKDAASSNAVQAAEGVSAMAYSAATVIDQYKAMQEAAKQAQAELAAVKGAVSAE